MTRTLFSGQPSKRAISSRTNEGIWLAGVDGDDAVTGVGDRDERLECSLLGGRAAKAMFEDAIRLVECRLDVAATQSEIERDVGIGAAGEMLEIGERRRRA